MKKRVRVSLGIILALSLAVFLSRRPPPPEPLYQGKTVAAWASQALISPLPAEREKSAGVLRELGTDAVPALARLLATPDPVLAKPVKWVARHCPQKLSRVLLRMVNPFEAPRQRAAAAQGLRLLGTNGVAAVPSLSRALRDDPTVSWYAALALAQMGPPGTATLAARLPETGPPQNGYICFALASQGPAASNAVPALASALRSGSPDIAEKAAKTLSNVGRAAVPDLARALTNHDVEVRTRVIDALGQMGPLAREAIPGLLEIARTDQAPVRQAAVNALSQIRPADPAIVTALTSALKDPVRQVRLDALKGLSRSPRTSVSAAPALVNALQDVSPEIRGQAASLLGQMSEVRELAVPALLKKLDDENDFVRGCARQALQQLHELPSEKTG